MNNKNIQTLTKFIEYYAVLVDKFSDSGNSNQIRELHTMSLEMNNFLREKYQAETEDKLQELINNLKHNDTNVIDLEMLENHILGDSKSYIKSFELVYDACLNLLKTISRELKTFNSDQYDLNDLMVLFGKSKALIKITENLSFYLQEQERINQFKLALTDGIDKLEANFFSDILDFKLKSKNC